MLRNRCRLVLIVLISFSACAATLPQDRKDYILAHPHGWIEIVIKDYDIPYLPPTKENPNEPIFPRSCSVRIELNNENLLSSYAYPFGQNEPFKVETGFRFPVPAGGFTAKFTYTGCDVENGEKKSIVLEQQLEITENHVTEIEFNGIDLIVLTKKKNSVVTLEDVYEAITGNREPQ